MSEEKGLTHYETREILFYMSEIGVLRVELMIFQDIVWL